MTTRFVLFLAMGLWASAIDGTAAQGKPPKADVTAVGAAAPIRAGTSTRLTLKVRLPKDIHVQSDKPRDRLLIPTELTLKAPAGIVVVRIVYPKAEDLAQAARKEPLAVFSGEFTIEAHVTLAPDLAAGDVIVPGQLRYQACDASLCYAPARAETQWTLRITRGTQTR
jgi:hypothetical protein